MSRKKERPKAPEQVRYRLVGDLARRMDDEAMTAMSGSEAWKHPAHRYAKLLRGRQSSGDAKPGTHKAKRLGQLEAGFTESALKAVRAGDSDFFKRVATALDEEKGFAYPIRLAVIDAYAEIGEELGRLPTAWEIATKIERDGEVKVEERTIRSVCGERKLPLSEAKGALRKKRIRK